MSEPTRKRRSHVLEYLQKQKEEREAAEAENPESGGDHPFPDFRSELGLGKSQAEGAQ